MDPQQPTAPEPPDAAPPPEAAQPAEAIEAAADAAPAAEPVAAAADAATEPVAPVVAAAPPAAAPPPVAPPVAPPPAAPAAQPPAAAPVAAAAAAPQAWQADPAPLGPAPGVEFGGYGGRLIAYIVDGLILGLVIGVMWVVLTIILVGSMDNDGSVGTGGALVSTLIVLLSIAISLLYFPYFWQKSGQTPGMKIFSIKVVRDRDGGPVTWGSAILRYIGFFIDSIVFGIPLGFLWVFVDKRRRAWHDLIGGTIVIKS